MYGIICAGDVLLKIANYVIIIERFYPTIKTDRNKIFVKSLKITAGLYQKKKKTVKTPCLCAMLYGHFGNKVIKHSETAQRSRNKGQIIQANMIDEKSKKRS